MRSRNNSGSNWIWPVVLTVVLVALAAIQMIRVNRPRPYAESLSLTPIYTADGPILSGPVLIDAGGYHVVGIDLNRTATLTGRFRSGPNDPDVNCMVVSAEDLELWKQGLQFESISRTGYLPGGKIYVTLNAGSYALILDNRRSGKPVGMLAAEFRIE